MAYCPKHDEEFEILKGEVCSQCTLSSPSLLSKMSPILAATLLLPGAIACSSVEAEPPVAPPIKDEMEQLKPVEIDGRGSLVTLRGLASK